MNGAQPDVGSTTENVYNWLNDVVQNVVHQDTVSKSSDGTLVDGHFEGLTCNSRAIHENTGMVVTYGTRNQAMTNTYCMLETIRLDLFIKKSQIMGSRSSNYVHISR